MSDVAPLTPEQQAELTQQLGDAKPASSGLLMSFGASVQDRREHDHTTQREDWYCLNLAAYMGERAAPILRRLLDAETELAAARARIAELEKQPAGPSVAMTDRQLAEVGKSLAAYQKSHDRGGTLACCSAHAAADHVPALLAAVQRLTSALGRGDRATTLREAAAALRTERQQHFTRDIFCAGLDHAANLVQQLAEEAKKDVPVPSEAKNEVEQ